MSSVPRQRQWWWVHLSVLLAVRALAAPEPPSKVVLLEAVGEASDVAALKTSLEDWLRAMQLELRSVDALPPIEAPSFARVRAVWTEASCVVEVYTRDGVLKRRKELPRGGPPLLVSESAALIAQAGVQEVSIEEKKRDPLPAPEVALTAPPAVQAPPEDDAPFGLRAGIFGQARAFGAEHPVAFGAGGEVSAAFGDSSWKPGVSLLVGYQGPLSVESAAFAIQLQTVQLRLMPTLKHRMGAFEVEFGLGGGVDLLIARTTSTYAAQFVEENRLDPAPFFSASALLRWNLTNSTSLFLRALVDVDPARRRYVVDVRGERESHLVPWIGRPALQVGFTFDILTRAERAP